MRVPRIKEVNGGYYHVISRVVDRRMVLDHGEKERFRRLMRKVETFSGVRILTYAALDNHFHILLHVPPPEPVDDEEFARRLAALYDKTIVRNLQTHLAMLREAGHHEAAESCKAPYVRRMYELSEFMKTLKQRFSQSFNGRHQRKGTLWEERFKSILVQGRQGALSAIAAYIDLNALRAGIVSDPADYRFCGYGEAVGGSRRARRGLCAVMLTLGLSSSWSQVHGGYRTLIYATGHTVGVASEGQPVRRACPPALRSGGLRRGFSQAELRKVLDADGKLSAQQALHCRVRYFSDGLVLGSRAYVDDAFSRYRGRFSPKRNTGARPIRGVSFDDLCTARRLRLQPISVPAG